MGKERENKRDRDRARERVREREGENERRRQQRISTHVEESSLEFFVCSETNFWHFSAYVDSNRLWNAAPYTYTHKHMFTHTKSDRGGALRGNASQIPSVGFVVPSGFIIILS